MGFFNRLDRLIGWMIGAAQWLALPVIVLLFLQWPLRDIVQGWSREANDLAQWIFALFVAFSVTAATRAGTHLHADVVAQRYSPRTRERLRRAGMALAFAPWALFVLFSSRNIVLMAVQYREAFPDTGNPGYFIIKIALWLMAVMILAQAGLEIFRPFKKARR